MCLFLQKLPFESSPCPRFPLRIIVESRLCNFLKHIDKECKPNSLVSKAKQYESHITNRPIITSDITQRIINSAPKNPANDTFASLSKYTINKLLRAKFEKIWNDRISTCSKAITYKTHKTNVACEKYLSLVKNRTHRRTLTKLRLSDHCLAIEKGRHSKPPVTREDSVNSAQA